jgi:hypothetical protein
MHCPVTITACCCLLLLQFQTSFLICFADHALPTLVTHGPHVPTPDTHNSFIQPYLNLHNYWLHHWSTLINVSRNELQVFHTVALAFIELLPYLPLRSWIVKLLLCFPNLYIYAFFSKIHLSNVAPLIQETELGITRYPH